MRNKIIMTTIITTLFLGLSCSPKRQLANIMLKKPELLIEHCIDTYNPILFERVEVEKIIYDTMTVEIDCEDSLNIGKKVIAKCPPNEIIKETKITEVRDVRVEKQLQSEADGLHKQLGKLSNMNKMLMAIGAVLLAGNIIFYLTRKR